jgi:hypothetical protein
MRFAFAVLISIASAGIHAQPDKQEKSGKPAEWVVATSEVNVFAGERFEILVVSPAGEPLPDEIEVRMKVGPEELLPRSPRRARLRAAGAATQEECLPA